MRLYSSNDNYKLYQGSMLDMAEFIEPNSIDSIVTDPPYELNFMGKGWDSSGIAFQKETWEKCLSVLKPGGYLLAFGGSRTFHRIACAIEDAGFEIRDTIMWLYGSGFPKSMNIGLAIDKKLGIDSKVVSVIDCPDLQDVGEKQKALGNGHIQSFGQITNAKRLQYEVKEAQNEWAGWGTALKPSYEPIIVARKPCEGTTTDNVMKYGVGGINIDGCRVGEPYKYTIKENGFGSNFMDDNWQPKGNEYEKEVNGRFPSNVILTYDETDEKEVCGGMPDTKSAIGVGVHRNTRNSDTVFNDSSCGLNNTNYDPNRVEGYADSGSVARYFYCAKASKRDRDEGLDKFPTSTKVFNGKSDESSTDMKDVEQRFTTQGKNIHPTVKPTDLMQYLVRLVTPNGGTVLDPFNGSGSTGKGAMYENRDNGKNYHYIGIELTDEYLPISKARIEFACNDDSEIVCETVNNQGEIDTVKIESLF